MRCLSGVIIGSFLRVNETLGKHHRHLRKESMSTRRLRTSELDEVSACDTRHDIKPAQQEPKQAIRKRDRSESKDRIAHQRTSPTAKRFSPTNRVQHIVLKLLVKYRLDLSNSMGRSQSIVVVGFRPG